MILFQIVGLVFCLALFNLIGIVVFGFVKELFFKVYVPNKEDNPNYERFAGAEQFVTAIIVGILLFSYIQNEKNIPNKEILMVLGFLFQGFIVWKLYTQLDKK